MNDQTTQDAHQIRDAAPYDAGDAAPATSRPLPAVRTEWTWRHNAYTSTASATTDRSSAERSVTRRRTTSPGETVTLMRRTVTDWTPADDHDAAGDTSTTSRPLPIHDDLHRITQERDHLAGLLARIGDTISPTGERPEEALGTLVADVEALVQQRDQAIADVLGSAPDRAQGQANVTRLHVTVTWHGDYYQPHERADMLRAWITAALDDRDDCPTVDITETPGPAATEALRPADWERRAVAVAADALAETWPTFVPDPETARRIATTTVRAVIDAGLAGPGGCCPQCGSTYPRTMPAGEDARCWTCSTKDQTTADGCGTCWTCRAANLDDPAAAVIRAALDWRAAIDHTTPGKTPCVDLVRAVDELLTAPACVDLSVPAGEEGPATWHWGRSWTGHAIEDTCPCQKAPCGLIDTSDPDCPEHSIHAGKSVRQSHPADRCPGKES